MKAIKNFICLPLFVFMLLFVCYGIRISPYCKGDNEH